MNKILRIAFWHDKEVLKDKVFAHSALKAQAASLKIAVLSLLKPILNTDKVNSYAETKCLPPLSWHMIKSLEVFKKNYA